MKYACCGLLFYCRFVDNRRQQLHNPLFRQLPINHLTSLTTSAPSSLVSAPTRKRGQSHATETLPAPKCQPRML